VARNQADLLPSAQAAQRVGVNDTAGALPQGLLHQPFLNQVHKRPRHTAIATCERRLTYEELYRHARRLAQRLRATGRRSEPLGGARSWKRAGNSGGGESRFLRQGAPISRSIPIFPRTDARFCCAKARSRSS
jgi:hypothetical protein